MEVSILGYGTSPQCGVFDTANLDQGTRMAHYSISYGIKNFDMAPMLYGVTLAEKRPGVAIKCGRYDVDTTLSRAHCNLLEDKINDELVPLSKEKGFVF